MLPKEAQLIAFLDGPQLRNTKLWEDLGARLQRDDYLKERLEPLRTFLALELSEDIETLSLAAWLDPPMQPEYVGVLRLSKQTNTSAFQAALQAKSKEQKLIGGAQFSSYSGAWVSLLGDGGVLFGSEKGVARALLVQQGKAESVLQNERLASLREQVGAGQFFIVADVPALLGAGAAFFLSKAPVPGLEGLSNLAGLSSVVLSVDFYNGVQGSAKLRVSTPEAAEALANQPLVQGLAGMGSLFFLRNMGDWLRSEASGQDWVLRISIPTRQASSLLVDVFYSLEQPTFDSEIRDMPMEQEFSPP